jgi:hypothetical protein
LPKDYPILKYLKEENKLKLSLVVKKILSGNEDEQRIAIEKIDQFK